MIILVQNNYRFFPVGCRAKMPPATAGLAQAVRRTHFSHLDVIQLLNGISNLNLIGLPVHFKGIRIPRIGKMHPLLCNQRLDYYVIVIHNRHLMY